MEEKNIQEVKKQIQTVTFAFDDDQLLLLVKDRPEWQRGQLNGIGGKFEEDIDDSPAACAAREFNEETDISLIPADFIPVIVIEEVDYVLHVFATSVKGMRDDYRKWINKKTIDGVLKIVHISEVIANRQFSINDILWLAPLSYCTFYGSEYLDTPIVKRKTKS